MKRRFRIYERGDGNFAVYYKDVTLMSKLWPDSFGWNKCDVQTTLEGAIKSVQFEIDYVEKEKSKKILKLIKEFN